MFYDPTHEYTATIHVCTPHFDGEAPIDPTALIPEYDDLTIYQAQLGHYPGHTASGQWTFEGIGWYHHSNGSMLVVPLDAKKDVVYFKGRDVVETTPSDPGRNGVIHINPDEPDHGHQLFRFYWWSREPNDMANALNWMRTAPARIAYDQARAALLAGEGGKHPEVPMATRAGAAERQMIEVRRADQGPFTFWSKDANANDLESILALAMDNIGVDAVVGALANVLSEREKE